MIVSVIQITHLGSRADHPETSCMAVIQNAEGCGTIRFMEWCECRLAHLCCEGVLDSGVIKGHVCASVHAVQVVAEGAPEVLHNALPAAVHLQRYAQ